MGTQQSFGSWGLYPRVNHSAYSWPHRAAPIKTANEKSILCYGLGRSYGDSCLNDEATIVLTRALDHFISFDRLQGILRCEAGVSFAQILNLIVPMGWFLPVTPGTKFVTVGGAIANDVHGKNHHCDGTFGHHLIKFELLRSDGSRMLCSPNENHELFYATIGGLGLTGAITWAEFKLKSLLNPFITQEIIRFESLHEFFEISQASEADFMYTVSWVDCLAKGKQLGRGHFIRGNHAPAQILNQRQWQLPSQLNVPLFLPDFALNPLTVKAFNMLYYNKQQAHSKSSVISYNPFFYPLDAIQNWNRIYGRRGFLQWQCVVPFRDGEETIRDIFTRIAHSRLGSFLAVLKTFGSIPSLGLLSFPREGVTLALDFPNVGGRLIKLLDELDQIVIKSGGGIYPAKDAHMSPEVFAASFPRVDEFLKFKDPCFSSTLWRRVTEG